MCKKCTLVIKFNNPHTEFLITEQEGNIDGLNFLAGKKMSYVKLKGFTPSI